MCRMNLILSQLHLSLRAKERKVLTKLSAEKSTKVQNKRLVDGVLSPDPSPTHFVYRTSHFEYRTADFVYRTHFVYRTTDFVYRATLFVYRTPLFVYRTPLFVYRTTLFVYRTTHIVYRTTHIVYSTASPTLRGGDELIPPEKIAPRKGHSFIMCSVVWISVPQTHDLVGYSTRDPRDNLTWVLCHVH